MWPQTGHSVPADDCAKAISESNMPKIAAFWHHQANNKKQKHLLIPLRSLQMPITQKIERNSKYFAFKAKGTHFAL